MKIKKNYSLIVFGIITFTFFIFFTHLIIKTDDGHFLGILNEKNFILQEWLRERYLTVSGRTVSEFLMMNFLKINPVFWKISASLLFIFIAWFLQKISSAFSGCLDEKQKSIFACCVPFLVFIGALNSGAFWFAGSFTFLFPFVAFLIVILPSAFDLLKINYSKIIFIIFAVPASLLATSQEQTAALTLAFLLISIIFLLIKGSLKLYHFLPLPFCAAGAYHLFSSPGMSGRLKTESGSFPRFNEMNIPEKALCGFSNYFAYSFFMSLMVTGIFAVLLFLTVKSLYDSKKIKSLSKIFITFFVIVCGGINLIYIAINRTIPDKGFQKAFQSGELDFINIFTLIFCFLLLLFFAVMLILLIKKSPTLGRTVAICFVSAVCSGVVIGFSSSIYASGQRVFYFTDMLTLAASVTLISAMKSKEAAVVYKTSIIITLLMFILNCFNFYLLEIPIMG